MSDTQWVQHKSGQGEKWEVHAESMQVWYCIFNGKPYDGNLVLPKSEYGICDPPEVWDDVTVTLGEPDTDINIRQSITENNERIGRITLFKNGYRVESVVVKKRRV